MTEDDPSPTLLDLTLVLLGASGLFGMWLLQLVWVSPFTTTMADLDALPWLTLFASWGGLAVGGTLLTFTLAILSVRLRMRALTSSRLALAAAALLPSAVILVQVYAVMSPLMTISEMKP